MCVYNGGLVEPGRGVQQVQQMVALAPGQARQALKTVLGLPGLHSISVNDPGRRSTRRFLRRFHTKRLPKRFHT
jgi:hypothetical protein